MVRSRLEAKGIVNVRGAKRELDMLMRRAGLWADDTARLGELAAAVGVTVQMERHYFNSGIVQPFTLP